MNRGEDVISESTLEEISRIVRHDAICSIARSFLGLKDAEVYNISHEHKSPEKANYEILIRWRGKSAGTKKDLFDVFTQAMHAGISISSEVFPILKPPIAGKRNII